MKMRIIDLVLYNDVSIDVKYYSFSNIVDFLFHYT